MNGGAGSGYYTVFYSDTVIVEARNSGFDYVVADVNYTLPANVERLTLSPISSVALIAIGNAQTNYLEGNGFANLLSGLGGGDYATGAAGADTLLGGGGQDSLYGGVDNDSLSGGAQGDQLYGDEGADTLMGGSENDQLFGGTQNDVLQGGLGSDTLRGGAGADTFLFVAAADSTGSGMQDQIVDFRTQVDNIDLHLITTGQIYIRNAAFGASGQAEIRYDRATGHLSGDTDGNGAADYQINLRPGTDLAGTDLVL